MTFFRVLVFSLCFAVLAAASASAEEVLKIKPRSGVFLKMLVDAPAAAKECGATSYHGFLEIEQKIVDAISSWIKSH